MNIQANGVTKLRRYEGTFRHTESQTDGDMKEHTRIQSHKLTEISTYRHTESQTDGDMI